MRANRGAGNRRHVTKDGRQLWVDISSGPVTYGDRRAHLVVARDVTERRRSEVDLRETQKMEGWLAWPGRLLTTSTTSS